MNKSDIEQIREIANAAWKDTYSNFIPVDIQDKVLSEAYSDEEMENRFNSSLNLVVESDRDILGYAFFKYKQQNKELFLESLYIHPNHQGKGIGKQLLLTGIERHEDVVTLVLTVYKGNQNITFYEKQGFEVVKENEGNFFEHPVVFIVMKKELQPSLLAVNKIISL